jgi:hypothetical protein
MSAHDEISRLLHQVDAEKAKEQALAEQKLREEELRQRAISEKEERAAKQRQANFLGEMSHWGPIIRVFMEQVGERWFPSQMVTQKVPVKKLLVFTGYEEKKVKTRQYMIDEHIDRQELSAMFVMGHNSVTTRDIKGSRPTEIGREEINIGVERTTRLMGMQLLLTYSEVGLMCDFGLRNTGLPPIVSDENLKQIFARLYATGPREIDRWVTTEYFEGFA